MVLAGMLAPIFMNGGDTNKSDEADIKAVEIDDVRQYKFTDKRNNVEYVITDKPYGVTTSRNNIE
jgi:tRNA G10  N-methylase Trm11